MKKMKREVAIVHYNTPELTEAAILSIRKHGGMDYHVTVFDNSNQRPFKIQMKGVTVIDNTKGKYINFDVELARYNKSNTTTNGWASDRHMTSVQKLMELETKISADPSFQTDRRSPVPSLPHVPG